VLAGQRRMPVRSVDGPVSPAAHVAPPGANVTAPRMVPAGELTVTGFHVVPDSLRTSLSVAGFQLASVRPARARLVTYKCRPHPHTGCMRGKRP
jgi:hypothetical protein